MKAKIKKIIASAMAGVLMLSTSFTTYAADNDSFAGWNDETKDDVWSVMENTQWDELQDKLIYKTTQIKTSMKAEVGGDVRGMESEVKKVLKSTSYSAAYAKTDYTELMLAMIQVLSSGNVSGNDPCHVNNAFPNTHVTTREDSIKTLFRHLTNSFTAYYNGHGKYPNIFKNDEVLGSAVQGTLFGSQYARKTEKYSADNAKNYYNNNKAQFSDYPQIPSPDFARLVCSKYKTVSANSGVTYNGSVTASMQKIANIAKNNQGTFPCTPDYCAAWVTGVYKAAGARVIPYGDAIDMWNTYKSTGSTSQNNIPPGAIVCGSGSGYMGSIYGHVGIYIGNGLVANNVGHFSIESLAQWSSWQTATCQGHRGWIGWVYPGGVPSN